MLNQFCKFLFLLFIGILLSGCFGYGVQLSSFATDNYHHYKKPYPDKGWENLEIYDEFEPEHSYEILARIIVTGNGGASERKLFKKLRREAGCYSADALVLIDVRPVERSTFNGFAAALNIISVVDGDACTYADLEMGEDYEAWEYEAEAIRFLDEGRE